MMGWTMQHARHAAAMVKQDGNPAARVYESIGSDCFLALAPGWLNLGLWEGPGSGSEAEAACRRMVRTLALALPAGGTILDVGNGLATQDPLIAEAIRPRRLVAVNITEWQLAAGRDRLREAAAVPVVGNAVRLPVADSTVDGVISVEAAFHFRSRRAFFDECYRVLRPGGALSISDIAIRRWPVSPGEVLAGLTQLRVFGLQPAMAMTPGSSPGDDAARRHRDTPTGKAFDVEFGQTTKVGRRPAHRHLRLLRRRPAAPADRPRLGATDTLPRPASCARAPGLAAPLARRR